MLDRNARKVAVFLALASFTPCLSAQEAKPPSTGSVNAVYKLDYVFSEVQNGKRINTRSYTTLLRVGERGSIRLGNRVPVLTGANNAFQYLDIGVNIDCRVEPAIVDAGIALFTSVDMSSVAPEQPGENRTGNPIVRQTKVQMDNIIPLDKKTLLGSADEVDGTGRFEFEVTVTRAR